MESFVIDAHICFFGASVTEQDKHHDTGEITGYVSCMENSTGVNIRKISRVFAGSNSIDDAGIAYVQRVVDSKPDCCVLDWITAGRATCSEESLLYVYSTLIEANIIPLTLAFPRSDRIQDKTDVFRKSYDLCSRLGLPFLDLSNSFDKSALDHILRDTVHTTPFGAGMYAEKIQEFLVKNFGQMLEYKYPKQLKSNIQVISSDTDIVGKRISRIDFEVGSVNGLSLTSLKFKLLQEQLVGPWTGYVQSEIVGESDSSRDELTFDIWCWRERHCIKDLSGWVEYSGNSSNFIFRCSAINKPVSYPDSVLSKMENLKQNYEMRPNGKTYLVVIGPEAYFKVCSYTEV